MLSIKQGMPEDYIFDNGTVLGLREIERKRKEVVCLRESNKCLPLSRSGI